MAELNDDLVDVSNKAPFTIERVTAKYDSLEKKWVVWRNFKNKTDIGWDNVRETISGNEHWCIDHKGVIQFIFFEF